MYLSISLSISLSLSIYIYTYNAYIYIYIHTHMFVALELFWGNTELVCWGWNRFGGNRGLSSNPDDRLEWERTLGSMPPAASLAVFGQGMTQLKCRQKKGTRVTAGTCRRERQTQTASFCARRVSPDRRLVQAHLARGKKAVATIRWYVPAALWQVTYERQYLTYYGTLPCIYCITLHYIIL